MRLFILKVQLESLKKEIQEKQDLLCQAAKAIELLEESQKSIEEGHSEKIDDLHKKIKFLEVKPTFVQPICMFLFNIS